MIHLYYMGNRNYERNGDVILMPTSCIVREQGGGSYELEMDHPQDPDGKWEALEETLIIKAPVAAASIPKTFSGAEVDVYAANRDTELREAPNEPQRISYPLFEASSAMVTYTVGSKVSYIGHNYQMYAQDPKSEYGYWHTPDNYPDYWRRIADYSSGAQVLVRLKSGTEVYLIEQTSGTWYQVMTKAGVTGYVKAEHLTFVRHQTPEEIEAEEIREQLFRIYSVNVDTKGNKVRVNARHVSFDGNGVFLGDCEISQASPAMAIQRQIDARLTEYQGEIGTNLTSDDYPKYSAKLTGKSVIAGLLDPKDGIVAAYGAHVYRNNWDIAIVEPQNAVSGVRLRYGKNLRGVSWGRKTEKMATRVIPVAKGEGGADLYLPEIFVDSPYIDRYDVIMTERLVVNGQVGKDDGSGTETTWTEQSLYAEMRRKAEERFSVDHIDAPQISLAVEFTLLGDTEEYRQYRGLEKLHMYDSVSVKDPRIGLDVIMTVMETEWDAIRKEYRGIKLADTVDYGAGTIPGYQIQSGAIGGSHIQSGAISGGMISAGAITARTLAAEAITSDKIAARAITTRVLEAEAVTAEKIHAGAVTAEKVDTQDLFADSAVIQYVSAQAVEAVRVNAETITAETAWIQALNAQAIVAVDAEIQRVVAGQITTDALYAGIATIAQAMIAGAHIGDAQIDFANIADLKAAMIQAVNLDAQNISTGVLRASIAVIQDGEIDNADINTAHIVDLTADSFIAHDAVTDRYTISKLKVNNAQLVTATVGELVVKASDSHYYRIDVDPDTGEVTTTDVTQELSPGEITAGITSDGVATIIETDLTVDELSANNFSGLSALIDKIRADRIDVDTLFARQAFIGKLNTTDITGNSYLQLMVNTKNATYTQWADPALTHTVQPGDTWNRRAETHTHATMAAKTHAELGAYPHWAMSRYFKRYVRTTGGWELTEDLNEAHETQARILISQDSILQEVDSAVRLANDAITRTVHIETLVSEDGIRDMIVTEISGNLDEIIDETAQAAIDRVLELKGGYKQWDTPNPEQEETIATGTLWYKDHGMRTHGDMAGKTHQQLHSYPHKSFSGGELYMYIGTGTAYDPTKWVLVSDPGTTYQTKVELNRTTEEINAEVTRIATSLSGTQTDIADLRVSIGTISATVTSVQRTADGAYQQMAGILIQSDGVHVKASAGSSAAGVDITFSGITLATNKKLTVRAQDLIIGSGSGDTLKAQLDALSDLDTLVRTTGVPKVVTTAFTISGSTMTMGATGTIVVAANKAIQIGTSASNSFLTVDNSGVAISTVKSIALKAGGTFTINSNNFAVNSDGTVTVKGTVEAAAGKIGTWNIGTDRLESGTGSGYVALNSKASDTYAIWAGSESPTQAPYRVKRDGTVYLTSLIVVGENGSETTVNLRTAGLWKLSYHTVKAYSTNSITLSNGVTVNFNTAASVVLNGSWSGSSASGWTFTVTNTGNTQTQATTITRQFSPSSGWNANWKKQITISGTGYGGGLLYQWEEDASGAYSAGSPVSAALGALSHDAVYGLTVTKGDNTVFSTEIDAQGIYDDAREGYTLGVFVEYTGQKYRISNGNYRNFELFRRETNPGGGWSYWSVGTGYVQVAEITDTLYVQEEEE